MLELSGVKHDQGGTWCAGSLPPICLRKAPHQGSHGSVTARGHALLPPLSSSHRPLSRRNVVGNPTGLLAWRDAMAGPLSSHHTQRITVLDRCPARIPRAHSSAFSPLCLAVRGARTLSRAGSGFRAPSERGTFVSDGGWYFFLQSAKMAPHSTRKRVRIEGLKR